MLETSGDRYLSFCNIQCDENADRFMAILVQHLKAKHGNPLWQDYFWQKIEEQQRIQRDNLHFIGNQTNPLYEYMEECGDQQATDLLYKIEQECC